MIKVKDFKLKYIKKLYSYILIIVFAIGILGIILVLVLRPHRDAGVEYSANYENKTSIMDGQKLKIKYHNNIEKIISMGLFVNRVDDSKPATIHVSLDKESGENIHYASYDAFLVNGNSYVSIILPEARYIGEENIIFTIFTEGIYEDNPLSIYYSSNENSAESYINDDSISDIGFVLKGRNPSLFYLWYPIFLIAFDVVLMTLNDWSSIKKGNRNQRS